MIVGGQISRREIWPEASTLACLLHSMLDTFWAVSCNPVIITACIVRALPAPLSGARLTHIPPFHRQPSCPSFPLLPCDRNRSSPSRAHRGGGSTRRTPRDGCVVITARDRARDASWRRGVRKYATAVAWHIDLGGDAGDQQPSCRAMEEVPRQGDPVQGDRAPTTTPRDRTHWRRR